LKLQSHKLLSTFAFNFNSRRYTKVAAPQHAVYEDDDEPPPL
jgi:hypothetical protein